MVFQQILIVLSFYSVQALVSATGVFAFAINLSIFWIIGNTSPMTYPFQDEINASYFWLLTEI
jgi:hypothetical protein